MSSPASELTSRTPPHDQLFELISSRIITLGYQLVHLEIQLHKQKILRVFIDHLEPKGIGIEDCVKVSRALDEFLDETPLVSSLLPSTYELEVSSPGADRPLRTASDFERFQGREVRIHVYRPLQEDEINNPKYLAKNPKQKNFLGTLIGFQEGKVVLCLASKDHEKGNSSKKAKAKNKAQPNTNSVEEMKITIPLPLISKANLEPHFDFEASDERE